MPGVFFGHAAAPADLAQDAEDGADRDVDVDVAAAVQRIGQQHVFALRAAVGHDVNRVHFLAGHRRKVAAPLVGFNQHFVADDVELFLQLTLEVGGSGGAEHIAQGPLVHGDGDALAGARHDFDQQAQLAGYGPCSRCCSTRYCVRLMRFMPKAPPARGRRPRARQGSNRCALRPGRSLRARRCDTARPSWPNGPLHAPAGSPPAG